MQNITLMTKDYSVVDEEMDLGIIVHYYLKFDKQCINYQASTYC